MPGRRLKFPDPKDCKAKEPAVLCPAERVIGLYNQNSGSTAKRISKTVRAWFVTQALEAGWSGVHFLPEVQSENGAGCVLWPPPQQVNVTVTVTLQTLVLHAQSE
jgi:hypothetical protein